MNPLTMTISKKIVRLIAVVMLVTFPLSLGPRSAEGSLTFSFAGSDEGGTGSGTMEFVGLGTSSLTLNIDNTSPLTLDDLTGINASGITGFGFDADTPIPDIVSWALTADDSGGSPILIGDSDGGAGLSTNDWVMTTGVQGIQLDFFPTTSPGVSGALYNPLQTTGFATPPQYFTQAVLTVEFDAVLNLDVHGPDTQGVDPSPLMRFQNVGLGGEGSLKLGQVPEAASVIIWGLLATIGVAYRHRRS